MMLRSRIELTKAVYTIGAKAIEVRREALDCSTRDLLVATPVLPHPVGQIKLRVGFAPQGAVLSLSAVEVSLGGPRLDAGSASGGIERQAGDVGHQHGLLLLAQLRAAGSLVA